MAKVKAFRAVRPSRPMSGLVATRSYISYDEKSIEEKLAGNPYSFLHVLHPDRKYGLELEGSEKYPLVKNRYQDFKYKKIFIKDENPSYYIYRQVHEGISFTGIIAAVHVEDYFNGNIKLHEETLSKREEIFAEYLDITGFNSEPVLLTYKDSNNIESIIDRYTQERAEYEFATTNRNIHYLWMINKKEDIDFIESEFSKVENLYIADGHHRSASSAKLSQKYNDENSSKKDAVNHFMAYLIPESQLKIYSFNRLIKDLNGLSKVEFLIKLEEVYRIENKGKNFYQPSKKHHFSMYLDGEYYSLYLRKHLFDLEDPLSDLDSQLIYKTILNPILGIQDQRNDDRIAFISETNGAVAMEEKVDSGLFRLSFGLYPVSVEQLKRIADSKFNMPPKSTYIKPKLRSGLTIYEFE